LGKGKGEKTVKIINIKVHSDSWGEINWVSVKRKEEEKVSTVKLIPGKQYIVEPLNPQKKKHRGRICTITGFEINQIGDTLKIKVQFTDNNRHGKVSVEDLLEHKRRGKREIHPDPLVLYLQELNGIKG